jgi:hypothetical protein
MAPVGRSISLLLGLAACGDPSPATRPGRAEPTRPAHIAPAGASPVAAAIALGTTPMAVDETGVPRLLVGTSVPKLGGATPARAYVSQLAAAWGVSRDQLPVLDAIGDIPVRGGTITRLRPTIDGMAIDGGELRVLVRPDGTLGAIGGKLYGTDRPRTPPTMIDDEAGAVARALGDTYKIAFDRRALAPRGPRMLRGRSGAIELEVAGARKAWYPTGGTLTAVWIVEALSQDLRRSATSSDGWRTVIDGNGKVLARQSLVADASFTYRVFADPTTKQPHDGPHTDFSPHPTGIPDFSYPSLIPPSVVTVDSLSSNGDPWLVAGKVETKGNNVDAYADRFSPSGFSNGDIRATTTAASAFDHVYDTALQPNASVAQQMAAITSTFYSINYLHDFWYDSGFTEAAGNAQEDNYGRGGADRDALLAEVQDYSGMNNANMFTPSDGIPPRMQLYTFTGVAELVVNGRVPSVRFAPFGAPIFNVTAEVMFASDACTALVGDYTGKIVLVERGQCTAETKLLMAQNAGAVGMVTANAPSSPNPTVPETLTDDPTITTPITIGILSVNAAEGTQIRSELDAGAVTARITHDPDYDGSLEGHLISHEFGHYLHHRLSDCTTTWCRAMSEGWGDYIALLHLARAGDNFATGAWATSIYTTRNFTFDPGYYGGRRAPYSANTAINALSYRHMANGEPLPTHPMIPLGPNSEVHNAGEVWASALWEGYVALQASGGTFDENHRKAADYVVSGLLLMAKDVTPTEARDAILAAARAGSHADHDVLAAAFARRGLGTCAVTPARDSTTFVGIVESAALKGIAQLGAAVLAVDSCDNDGILDGGETARITVPIANTGPIALTNVVATLSTTTTGLSVSTTPITIANLPAYSSMDVAFEISLDDTIETPVAGSLSLNVTMNNGCAATATQAITLRLNTDDIAMVSATDSFDAGTSVWTASTTAWRHVRETALDGSWHGDATGAISDVRLETPPVTVDGTAPFTMTFQHRYEFEFDGTAWDGGVIELSSDGGATWVDVSTLGVTPGYGATISNEYGNPLADRQGYTDKNPAYPATDAVTLDFGTQLASMTVKVRFRIGTDVSFGTPGWDVDDVELTGIVGTPFPAQVADEADCSTPGPDAGADAGADASPMPPDAGGNPGTGDGGCCDAGPVSTANLGLALGVLALVIRRRRQRC